MLAGYNAAASTYGLDWRFDLGTGNNPSLLSDIYDDGRIGVQANGKITQTNGVTRLIGYDNPTSRADWGLGSNGLATVYWSNESWGQVDPGASGHCQPNGVHVQHRGRQHGGVEGRRGRRLGHHGYGQATVWVR